MSITPNRAHPDVAELEADLEVLVRAARDDLAALLPVLDICVDVQWERSPQPHLDVSERKRTGSYNDPTAQAALDRARLGIRTTLARSERELTDAVVSLRGVRRGLELALANVAQAGATP